ncbi:uncharacterized protein LOC106876744 isoform X2 [Octopus bimaculoides]|uniref:uncharacterized protein LOC106876744 isoform X2 n=1 Tax=Octopus bimaculoides TaxID=37653 RepID=UPI0022E1673E|nr:uncharacterized protein LOC106876744 isoform X2 [Octopus bimaculoides]
MIYTHVFGGCFTYPYGLIPIFLTDGPIINTWKFPLQNAGLGKVLYGKPPFAPASKLPRSTTPMLFKEKVKFFFTTEPGMT